MYQVAVLVIVIVQLVCVSNKFQYGKKYHDISTSSSRYLGPSTDLREVCEEDSFVMECPQDTYIHIGDQDIQFGRNGRWEKHSRCGKKGEGDVGHCGTVDMKYHITNRCEGKQSCGIDVLGTLSGVDPCPPINNRKQARKYLTISFDCVARTEKSRNTLDESSDMMETEFYNKLKNVTEFTEELKKSTTEFLENAFNKLQIRSIFGDPNDGSTELMNLTERVGGKLMKMLDDVKNISEFELETSKVSLKIVKKTLTPAALTIWMTSNSVILLPDQEQLVNKENKMEIMMASYNNLELDSVSDVITVSVNKDVNLTKPLIFLLANKGDRNVSCAFWSFSYGLWSEDGCNTICHNDTHTKCSCNHLTNFALIFNVHEEFVGDVDVHARQLKTITYIGFTISIFCIVLTIILFFVQKNHQKTGERDNIHINLCASLLIAEVLFMFGINQTTNSFICSLIAVSLHYFFLASFAWMFLEGLQIYIMLVRVFESSSYFLRNLLIGYILPLFIVLSSFLIDFFFVNKDILDVHDMCFDPSKSSSYGTKDYCWLRVDNHFVLSFIIPAVIVILSNICFLSFAIYSMFVHKQSVSSQTSHELLVSYMKGVGVLMCLLGSTWVTGILYLFINSLYLAYLFTILNSLQGVGIFIFQYLLNPAIHVVLKRYVFNCLNRIGVSGSLGSYLLTQSTNETNAKNNTSKDQAKDVNLQEM